MKPPGMKQCSLLYLFILFVYLFIYEGYFICDFVHSIRMPKADWICKMHCRANRKRYVIHTASSRRIGKHIIHMATGRGNRKIHIIHTASGRANNQTCVIRKFVIAPSTVCQANRKLYARLPGEWPLPSVKNWLNSLDAK